MSTTDNYGLKIYEGTDLFNPLTFENVNFETLDTVLKAISDKAVGTATELVTGTVHTLTRTVGMEDRDTFIFTATSNFTAGDTFVLDGVQVSALTVAGATLADNCYIIGSSVLVHVRDTLLTFYVAETTAKNAERLGGELPAYYATANGLNGVITNVTALATKVGTAVLTTQAQDCSGAINELDAGKEKAWTLAGSGASATIPSSATELRVYMSLSIPNIVFSMECQIDTFTEGHQLLNGYHTPSGDTYGSVVIGTVVNNVRTIAHGGTTVDGVDKTASTRVAYYYR